MRELNYQSSAELCAEIAKETDEVILAFSRGKDAIASYGQLKRFFPKIHLYHLYTIPHLSFVDDSLRYFEDEFKTEILNLPHPSLYRWLNELTFQAPENCATIEGISLPTFDYADVYRIVREVFGAASDCPIASGVRAADSIVRRLSIQKHGAYNHSANTFFPVYDWTKDRVIGEVGALGVRLPRDYDLFGRSFDGIDWRFLAPLRRELPEDYEKIRALFPLCELEFFREEVRTKWQDAKTV